jgi:hypothetical protein
MPNAIPFTPLTWQQVTCPACGADPTVPCLGKSGQPRKHPHDERRAYAADLNERAQAPTPQGRWYRHHFRQGRIPRPPQPHGTWAAYKRHRKAGEVPCEPCAEANRRYWRERHAKT